MRTLSTLFVVLALVLALAGQAPGAQDLTGDWTFSFTTADGSTYSDPATIRQNGNRFTGTVTYTSEGQAVEESFEGVVNADDSVVFTLYDQGQPVYHQGQVGPDGNTISGTWSVGDGSGTFTITRSQGRPLPNGQPPDLTGHWTFDFVTEDGTSYSDPASIRQNGNTFSGAVTYYDNGQAVQEPFDGTINPDGSVTFTLYDQGEPVHHEGRISPDGNTISGTWSFSDGKGTFTITRGAPVDTGGGSSGYNLAGNWTFSFTTEEGASYSDPATIQQTGDQFTGTVTYSDQGRQYEDPFEGVVRSDGSVEFVLYDQGEPVQHWGRVSQDGNAIQGDWSFSGGSGTFTLTRN